jgi:hypothetical protein
MSDDMWESIQMGLDRLVCECRNREIQAILQSPDTKASVLELGADRYYYIPNVWFMSRSWVCVVWPEEFSVPMSRDLWARIQYVLNNALLLMLRG